jgi:branched-chain amino acid transport system substrate-binding protein
MKIKPYVNYIYLLIFIALFISLLIFLCNYNNHPNIYLALAGPLSGKSFSSGEAYLKGAHLYIDEINKQGGIDGKSLILDTYDDQNSNELAVQKAREIADNQRAMGVIGHHFSSCSIAGGKVYQQFGIPAVTPTSTNVDVTLNNPWYFRISFHDRFQARFLANYAVKILTNKHCVVISEKQTYGAFIAEIFVDTFKNLDGTIKNHFIFDANAHNLNDHIDHIVQSLKKRNDIKSDADTYFIFIAAHIPEGLQLIRKIRNNNNNKLILLPDSFAGKEFASKLANFPEEQLDPGFLTNNIYLASPFFYDTANKEAQIFKQKYVETYNQAPDWRAAFAYDAAKMLCQAMKNSNISGNQSLLKEERKRVRDYLISINNSKLGIDGLTGKTWFDSNGDVAKPLSIGTFYYQNLVSSFTQLKPVNQSYFKEELQKKIAEGSVVNVDNNYMYRTNVIYTGVNINSIEELDFNQQIHNIDFYIWFKYQGNIDVHQIQFLNAVRPIQLGAPIQKESVYGEQYERYHVNGQFYMNTTNMFMEPGSNLLGFSFRHKQKNSHYLNFVSDIHGMNAQNNHTMLENLNQPHTILSNADFNANKILFYSDISNINVFGSPKYLVESNNGFIEYSCYNFFIQINENQKSFRRVTWNFYLNAICTTLSIIFILSSISFFKQFVIRSPRLAWFIQLVLGYILLISSEPLLLTLKEVYNDLFYFEIIKNIYDIFWWVTPAIFVNLAIKRFIWIPLEEKTGRKIPKIVTNSVVFMVYLLTSFGIIAYVFDQKLTSLLATSGVLAMIIGLAIQVNISNIFSGIVINIEQPFRIGDWIKIDHKYKGKVIDITWRTTRILTLQGNILSFPNGYTSESPINNYCFPDRYIWVKIVVHVSPEYPPDKIEKICIDAVLSIDGLVKEKSPIVRFEISEWSADYIVLFCIDDYENKFKYKSMAFRRIWTHLNRIGIEPAIKKQEIHVFKGLKNRGEAALSPMAILQEIDIFMSFPEEIKKDLALKMHHKTYQPEEAIIKQGDPGDSLFIVVEGSVSVRINIDNKQVEVDRMGANAFFGEMALLTGELRTASIVAISDCVLYEITKNDISPLLSQYPEIINILSKELTRRALNRQKKKDKYNEENADKEALNKSFFSKITHFFSLNKPNYELSGSAVEVHAD